MKNSIKGIGKMLSKYEQQQINGGNGQCNEVRDCTQYPVGPGKVSWHCINGQCVFF